MSEDNDTDDVPPLCNDCRYLGEDFGHAVCRRHPPIRDPGKDMGRWPRVSPVNDWCGEFEGA
jgi:hypothetical protein